MKRCRAARPDVFKIEHLQHSLYVSPPSPAGNLGEIAVPSILIADDNPAIRSLLRSYVESQTGFKACGEAYDGVDAIEKAKQLQPDVVLIDLSMPRLNGLEAASILKRTMPATKVILFSFHVEHLGRSLAKIVGVDFVLSKDEPLSKLADHLRTLLPGKAEMNASAHH